MQGLEEQKAILIRHLITLGVQSANRAKQNGNYTDNTGSLRNSIGFVIAENGKIIHASLPETAMDYVNEIMREYPSGIVLLVFAGMHYASYVQAKSFDVLASSKLAFERDLDRIIEQLNGNSNRR